MTETPETQDRRLALTCGAVALAGIAHLGHAPLWIVIGLMVALAGRVVAARRGWGLPSRWVLAVLVVLATLSIVASYRTLNGLQAGTSLLMAMAALKALESRSPRDHAALVYIGYFLCLASLLAEASVLRLVHALFAVWLLTAALLASQRPLGAQLAVGISRLSGRLLALGLPLTLVLFFCVPRLEGRFWGLPTAVEDDAATGISEEMNPGAIAHLAQSDDPAFRVEFDGPLPPVAERYWRALVLEDFDGHTWRRSHLLANGAPPALEARGTSYAYAVSLEPTQQSWLPALDHLLSWQSIAGRRLHNDVWQTTEPGSGQPSPVTSVTGYRALSAPGAALERAPLSPAERLQETRLPARLAPRSHALAADLYREAGSPRAFIERVLARFRAEDYSYTLDPPPLAGDPIDDFLFRTRAGFCEHYASAFTVLMRAAGLPARVVIGFQGGEVNPFGEYLLVRQSNAHAWSEVWLAGEGWVRFDPTAAIAPERIRNGLDGALPHAKRARHPFLRSPWVLKARDAVDAMRARWNHSVVGYSAAQQTSLLDRLGWIGSPMSGLIAALAAGFLVAGLGLVALQSRRWRAPPRDPVAVAWDRLCERLANAGYPRGVAEGPLDYGARLGREGALAALDLPALAARYARLRYGPDAAPEERLAFAREAARVRLPRTRPPRAVDERRALAEHAG